MSCRSLATALTGFLCSVPAATLAATGGPDAAGYTWRDSDSGESTAVPNYVPADLRAQGFTGDDTVVAIALPAPFPFHGANVSTVWLSTNGWLSFADPVGNSYPTPAALPTAAAPNALLAFFWDDWTVDTAVPSAWAGPNVAGDGFTIYLNLAAAADPARFVEVYLTLYNNGIIRTIYSGGDPGIRTASTVAGLEDPTGTIGLAYMAAGVPQNGARLRGSYAVGYYPDARLECVTGLTPIACGSGPTAFSSATGANLVRQYNCSPGVFDGNERVFEVQVNTLSDVTVDLVNIDGRNRSLFWLDWCHELGGCRASDPARIRREFVPPGTYLVVVDGATAADNGNFTLAVQCAPVATPMGCNTTRPADSTSGAGRLTTWNCAGAAFSGPERIYAIDAPGLSTLRATLANPSDLGLRVLITDQAGLNVTAPTCLASSDTVATHFGAQAGRYYVVVDGEAGASGSYDLTVECIPPRLACPPSPTPIDLANPRTYTGNTATGTNSVDTYFCQDSAFNQPGILTGYDGPEDYYSFTLAAPALVSFFFAPSDPNMRLLVLRSCYEGYCLMEGGCVESPAAGNYLLVVDGLNGASGSYALTPFLPPAAPYQRWNECPECVNGCGQDEAQIGSPIWAFNSGSYCGTACDFSLFAVVECGTNFHIPFWDVETGHMRIFDILRQQYVELTATNDLLTNPGLPASCLLTETGTYVEWVDSGCPGGGGSDCRTDQVIMDVSFQGTPLVCGVFRLDFIDWGGFEWQVYANCSAAAAPQYYLYRDLCSALANYNPRPEIGIALTPAGAPDVTIDNSQCPAGPIRGTIRLENGGCLPVAGLEVVVEQAPPLPANPRSFSADILNGGTVDLAWDYTPSAMPASLVFRIDPADRVQECHEALGSSVSCGLNGPLTREVTVVPCQQSDLYKAPLTFPPVSPARVAPWVYTRTAGCAPGVSTVGVTLELSPATSDVDLSDDVAGSGGGELMVYQLSCPASERIGLTKNRTTGKVHFRYF